MATCLLSLLQMIILIPAGHKCVGGMEVENGLQWSLATLIMPAWPECAAVLSSVNNTVEPAQQRNQRRWQRQERSQQGEGAAL